MTLLICRKTELTVAANKTRPSMTQYVQFVLALKCGVGHNTNLSSV